jgi:hypothetical protein
MDLLIGAPAISKDLIQEEYKVLKLILSIALPVDISSP